MPSYFANDPYVRNMIAMGLALGTTGRPVAGALIDPRTIVAASVQSTDNPLNTVTLDDEAMATACQAMMIVAFGTFAANTNVKDIKLKFGGTVIGQLIDNAGNGTDFQFVAFLFRTSADVQTGFCFTWVAGALIAATSINFAATVDENSALAVLLTADNNTAAAASATGKGLLVVPFGN